MRVSVLIPTINEEARIAAAVEQALAAGGAEVLVIDAGSTDRTCQLAEQAGAIVWQAELGRARQQNLGALHASGDVLLFLHADTSLDEGAVQQITSALADDQAQWGAFEQRLDASAWIYRWIERGNGLRVRYRGLAYGDQGLWLRRTFFERLGGFADVPLLEDLLLSQAARKQAWPVLLPGPLRVSARRWQRHGVVRQTLRNWSILLAHACGASPERLAQRYRRHDR